MRISSLLPEINEPKTYLTASVAAAATALTVANNAGFVANDYIIIGKPGQEGAEIHKISTVSGSTTINIAGDALDFAASINTEVTFIKYNQIKFYMGDWSARYATGTVAITKGSATLTGTGTDWSSITTASALLLNGKWYDIKSVDSATSITLATNYEDDDISSADYALVLFAVQSGSTVAIAVDQESTIWDDTDALAEDYYRSEYYNSTSTLKSSQSSIISGATDGGFSEFSLKDLEDQVLSDMRDAGAQRRSRDEIDRDINDAIKELINAIVSKVQEDYLSAYDKINFRASVGEYPLFSDFRKMMSIWVSYDGVNYKKAHPMRIGDDHPDAVYSESEPRYYIRDNVIGIKPVPTGTVTAGVKTWYEKRIPSLINEGDEIPYILRDWKRSIVDYALKKGLMADDQQKAIQYGLEFSAAKTDMVNTLKNRDLSTTKSIEIVNDEDLYE